MPTESIVPLDPIGKVPALTSALIPYLKKLYPPPPLDVDFLATEALRLNYAEAIGRCQVWKHLEARMKFDAENPDDEGDS